MNEAGEAWFERDLTVYDIIINQCTNMGIICHTTGVSGHVSPKGILVPLVKTMVPAGHTCG